MKSIKERLERAMWKLEQAGYQVIANSEGYTVLCGTTIVAVFHSLDELRAFADREYKPIWTGQQRVKTA